MNGAFYCRSELTAPWGLTLPPMPAYLWFHVVTSGHALLQAGTPTPAARAGDLALVPHGEGHVLARRARSAGAGDPRPGARAGQRPLRDPASRRRRRADHPDLRSGALRPSGRPQPGRRSCRTMIQVEAGSSTADRVDAEHAAADGRRGADAAPGWRGGDHAPRRHPGHPGDPRHGSTRTPPRDRLAGALQDRQIGHAITLIHRDPARAWTRRVAGGRDRDVTLGVRSPLHRPRRRARDDYVARWRMHLALAELSEHGATVGELAGRLGYRSEAAFARAFKRVVGIPPGRREACAGRTFPRNCGSATDLEGAAASSASSFTATRNRSRACRAG